ncbi:UNVERIFIED_CONTAM: hypothetical protein FKN15_020759 [Acipenser sinensis]
MRDLVLLLALLCLSCSVLLAEVDERLPNKCEETRLAEALDNICEGILEYSVHAERPGSLRYAKVRRSGGDCAERGGGGECAERGGGGDCAERGGGGECAERGGGGDCAERGGGGECAERGGGGDCAERGGGGECAERGGGGDCAERGGGGECAERGGGGDCAERGGGGECAERGGGGDCAERGGGGECAERGGGGDCAERGGGGECAERGGGGDCAERGGGGECAERGGGGDCAERGGGGDCAERGGGGDCAERGGGGECAERRCGRDCSASISFGTSETMATLKNLVHKGVKVELGIPYELWDEPSVEVSDMKKQCETMLEQYEEVVEGWYLHHQDQRLESFLCEKHVLQGTELGSDPSDSHPRYRESWLLRQPLWGEQGGGRMFLSIAFAAAGVAGALYSFTVAILGLVNGPTCLFPFAGESVWGAPFSEQYYGVYLHHSCQFVRLRNTEPLFQEQRLETWFQETAGSPSLRFALSNPPQVSLPGVPRSLLKPSLLNSSSKPHSGCCVFPLLCRGCVSDSRARVSLRRNESYLADRDLWTLCEEPEHVMEFNVALFSVLIVAGATELLLCGFQVVNGLFGCLCGTCGGKGVSAGGRGGKGVRRVRGGTALD